MRKSAGRHRKRATIGFASVLGVVAIAAAMFAVSTPDGQAAESCQGLDTALRNNLNFIAGQRATPDALSEARIANRQAVVDLIRQRRQAAGCTANVQADGGQQQQNQAADEAEAAAEEAVGMDEATAAEDEVAEQAEVVGGGSTTPPSNRFASQGSS